MYAANAEQVFRKNPQGKAYDCWVLFLRHGADTPREKAIRDKHEDIDTTLAEQNVNYTEVTTRVGKSSLYEKFGTQKRRHPLFLILNKHPLDYAKKDPLLVIEWGKWADADAVRDDLMALVNFFSDKEFRTYIAGAREAKGWDRVCKFLEKHWTSIVSMGISVATAVI